MSSLSHADCAFPAEGGDCEPIMGRNRSNSGGSISDRTRYIGLTAVGRCRFLWILSPGHGCDHNYFVSIAGLDYCDRVLLRIWILNNLVSSPIVPATPHSHWRLYGESAASRPLMFGRKPAGTRLTRGTNGSKYVEES
ncbi:hypothetical protein NEOLEDRAFT_276110 [Neolentinus lepideus HHB14362 ss-1]|uniref:Uncharacterized protein n=1 Tax=Neolentinus lepideus HHB14362 ss-1 TaxID=1314782 RepID=A0A165M793_9AGAM|nr:hypothetical protein NEOLEDRAFT_276110 [Neolentinus lepideus HHB14362 ss-1]